MMRYTNMGVLTQASVFIVPAFRSRIEEMAEILDV